MGTQNHPQFGVAARDLRAMRGRDPEASPRLTKRVQALERTLAYMVQIPREIVVMVGDTYVPVTFDTEGRIWLGCSDGSIVPARSPHARIHAIDLVVAPEVFIERVKGLLLDDPAFLAVICGYCDSGIAPGPWPGG